MVEEKSKNQSLKVGGQIQGIGLESFLQMVGIENKTCSLKISTASDVGYIHLLEGELVAAETQDISGEHAALTIIGWESSNIEIESFRRGKKRTINKPLMTLLMDGLKYKDEKRNNPNQKVEKEKVLSSKNKKLESAEKLVDQYVLNGNTDAAVKLLYDLIVKNARDKNFLKAETLREKLQDVDSLALNEIIRSAEIIEEEKSKSVDKRHMKIWKKIYSILSTEEGNDLYYSLKKTEIGPNKLIFQQGKLNSRLFFIDQGEVAIFFRKGTNNTLIKKVRSGDIFGDDSFFPISICTTSVKTLTTVKLHYLDRRDFLTLNTKFQALGTKLTNFCLHIDKSSVLITQQKINRREHKRYKVSGKVVISLQNVSGQASNVVFKAGMSDLSVGGLSAQFTISKEATARALLGKRIHLRYQPDNSRASLSLDCEGVVIAVIDHFFNNYSICIRFRKKISHALVEDLAKLSQEEKE